MEWLDGVAKVIETIVSIVFGWALAKLDELYHELKKEGKL